ncbi:MAG: TonB-dependent receptor [Massilia sp.]|nr:TonB-dependent receptor [Massilia sp.]
MLRHAYWLPLFLSTAALAQTVEITATRDRARQLDTAAMTVVAGEELLRYGDQTIVEALKRVPGITIRGAEIRMRGLGNGYTQVLLDGQPVPNGFSIDTISPELIERVEVMRVASAELGAQAIAGTINIVLRKSAARAAREFKLGLAASNGEYTPDLTAQVSGKGTGWTYALGAVAVWSRTLTDYTDDELGLDGAGAIDLRRRAQRSQHEVRPSINLTPRISWTLPNGDTLTSQNFVRMMTLDLSTKFHDETTIGQPTPFPDNEAIFRAHAETVRSDLQWIHQPEEGGRWDVKLGRNHLQRRATNTFTGFATGADSPVVRVVDSSADEDNVTFSGKVSRAPAGGHTLVAGWDAAYGWRTETRFEHVQPGDTVAAIGKEVYEARLDRIALFAQDDWSITPALSVSSGVRWEALRTRTECNVLDQVTQNTHVLSPLVQALYKLSASQQLRAGVTRTFKMPSLTNLALRRYTVDNNNSPLDPDQQGNPRLLPERAWGVDAAYERYFGKGAMFSASAYARRIEDVTIDRVEQVGTTWISTPVNAGRAKTWGVELEAKMAATPALDLRANMARNWSRVDSIPAPDNRLASQVPFSASVGLDHRLAAKPVTLGASFGYQGGGAVRLSERIGAWNGVQRDFGMYAVWRADARSQWRVSVANLLGDDHLSMGSFSDQSRGLRTATATSTYPTIRLAFEHKLGD